MKVDIALNVRYTGIAFMWIGPALMLIASLGVLRTWEIRSWPTTTARVLNNDVEVSSRPVAFSLRGRTANADYFTARCTYAYEVNGERFTETETCASDFDREEVERIRRQYAVGAEITIHYWSRRPRVSVLSTEVDAVGLSMMFGFGVFALPVGLVLKRYALTMQPAKPAEDLGARPVARGMHPSTPEQKSLRGPSPARHDAVQAGKSKATHWLLRSFAVCVGLVFVLFGGVAVAACVGQMAQGANAPAAAKVGMAVQVVTTGIFGMVALFGAFLIWVGLKRKGKCLGAASEGVRVESRVPAPGPTAPAIYPDASSPSLAVSRGSRMESR